MFGKLGQLFSLLNNPDKIRDEMQKFQQALGQIVAEGDAGAGMVKVRVNGRREVVSCQLTDEAVKGGDKELLEDLIKAAVNQALQKIQQQVAEESAKMAQALELDYERDEVNVHLDRLYPDIDLAETLSCVTGKWIKRITADEVEFADGSKQSLKKPDWRLLKPLIFWGPVV